MARQDGAVTMDVEGFMGVDTGTASLQLLLALRDKLRTAIDGIADIHVFDAASIDLTVLEVGLCLAALNKALEGL